MSLRVVHTSTACAILALLAATVALGPPTHAQTNCLAAANPIVCENDKPGDPASFWNIVGSGDGSIQGFATEFSVNAGQTVAFKIDTPAISYTIDIYRMGYYGGMGARRVATVSPSAALPQTQPDCLVQTATGLIDCGNWAVSASWPVPVTAVSGIHFAKLTRTDNGDQSHVFFVVRNDTRSADLLFQTSDTTWQAYNSYGGNSLYVGSPAGRAYKVSYNRPFDTRGLAPQDFVFNAEYPMVRWLEANGFDVGYFSGIDTDRFAARLLAHKVFLSVGHDEYWSGAQRANVEAARAAGVHLAFFSGNEVFWKTRWEPSIDGTATPYRTLVTYKETHANAKIDPAGPTMWTGTWRDPRFSPPADGGRPEHALSGTTFRVNSGTSSISVPSADGKHRFWRNTSVATLATGAVATLPNGTLGYEWDEAPADAFTPSGLMRLSTSTRSAEILLDYGSTYGPGTATHSLTLYRHPSGALVFGAGTIQWSWGLDANHDRGSTAADVRMKQATVNLFADMGVQPDTLEAGLTPATPSADAAAPTTTITSPAPGTTVPAGTAVAINGTAVENGGGVLTAVEVSVDGGTTWARATGLASWSYAWTAAGSGPVTIQSRGFDDSGNRETPSAGVTMTVTSGQGCPCTMYAPGAVPAQPDDGDASPVELGAKFRSDVSGFVTGVRFYKATANTGTHLGRLWSSTGTQLATVTFTNETASGWQQANFASPVPINANTTYIISYYSPVGHYTGIDNGFATALDRPPLHGLRDGVDGPNGVYRYGTGGGFPTSTYFAEAYWVDLVFSTVPPADNTPPTVTVTSPPNAAAGVDPAAAVTVTFNEAIDPATITTGVTGEGSSSLGTIELRDATNLLVRATVLYDPATRVATLRPDAALSLATTYSAIVRGGTTDPRIKDVSGNALAANATWSFTTALTPPPPFGCPCSIWTPSTIPPRIDDGDTNAVEVGNRFRSDVAGFITGARFYKSPLNTGTHVAKLWTNGGAQLGSATFVNETASGWQEVAFATPIAIAANTTYVISYHAPNGRYSTGPGLFATAGVDRVPLHALRDGLDGSNGVYRYGASAFPNQTYLSEGYFIDVVFNPSGGPDTTPPVVTSVSPFGGSSGVRTNTSVTALFNEAMAAATIDGNTMTLRDPSNALIAAAVNYDAASRTARLVPAAPLAYLTTYTAVVKGGATDPRAKDISGNALAANHTWSFTTAATPPPPPTEGPGGPVLAVTSAANPFSTYLAEILRAEGLNAFATAEVGTVNAGTLSTYDVVVLGDMPLTAAQVTMFTDWVLQGGNLIAMRPDKQLAGLMGLTDAGATLSDAYLLVNTSSAPGAGIVAQTLQYHGTADTYTLNGATAIATLYSTASTATPHPAVTMRAVGGGQAVAFTYDLARSVVYTRQGNPDWSGQDRDAKPPIRSNDLFFGAQAGDLRPDWVDFSKIAIPQADEQQRLLWNTVLHINAARTPLPRFWYFPRMLKAAVVMTADDHGSGATAGRFDQYMALSPQGCSLSDWTCIRGSSYLFPNTPITAAQVATYLAQGFELGVHVNTGCADYTPASLTGFYTTQLAQFAANFPQVPPQQTHRTHCIAWSDYATQPQVALDHGIRLDTNYYYWPDTWILDRPGLFTGSGMPMRFASAAGAMIDVYQATTQMTDESAQSYPLHVDALLDRALGPEGYYGAFMANMHTDVNPSPGSDAILASAQARGVPVISAKQMLDWLDGRNGSSFGAVTWSGSLLGFEIAVGLGADGLHALVPAAAAGSPIDGITVNGTPVAYTVQTIKGVAYAVFAAQSGIYQVSYGIDVIPPVISAVNASVADSAATISWATNEASDSLVSYGTAPDALNTTAASATLATSRSLTLPGLAPGTTFYYRVSSTDAAGNTGTSPATGNPAATFATPSPSLSIADASVDEGNTGTRLATFDVTLSVASQQTITVNYATSSVSATAGSDFTAAAGTLSFAPGETSKSIDIVVAGDLVSESDEIFEVTLSSPVNAVFARALAVGTIVNDEPVPTMTIADVSIAEGNSGVTNAVFAVTLSGASGATVSATFATAAGTALAGTDFVTTSGPVTFAPGATSQTIVVPVVGDQLDEADEQFVVNLSAPVNAAIADSQGSGTITDDDPLPSIAIADLSLTEGNSGTKIAAFALTLSAPSGRTVTVSYATANVTAASGSDYVATTGTATFAAGATSTTVNVTINGDTASELDETFVVNLSAPANATVADSQATGTILNDELPPTLSITDTTVTEGNTGSVNAVVTVSLSAASAQTITVAFASANGTATAGSDYTAVSGSLTFTPGATSLPITIAVTGDTAAEANETFDVNLSTPVNATIADGQGRVTIADNDTVITGLVAAWGFEEGTGTTTADAAGGGHTGTLSGATWSTAGKNGKALSFDGVNDMVTVADTNALDITRATLMAWVRPSALSDWSTVVLKERPSGLAYALYANEDVLRPSGWFRIGSDRTAAGTAGLALNTWTHLATTYDGTAIRVYVNGALVQSVAVTGNITTSANALRIGGNSIWGEWFAGLIDDVRVYNRALTLAEVQADMNKAVTPP